MTVPKWPDGIWTAPEYTAADHAYSEAMAFDVNDHMSALSSAVDAGIRAFLQHALETRLATKIAEDERVGRQS